MNMTGTFKNLKYPKYSIVHERKYNGPLPFLICTPTPWPLALGSQSQRVMVEFYPYEMAALSRTHYIIRSLQWFYESRQTVFLIQHTVLSHYISCMVYIGILLSCWKTKLKYAKKKGTVKHKLAIKI